jgi:hypothetical protein
MTIATLTWSVGSLLFCKDMGTDYLKTLGQVSSAAWTVKWKTVPPPGFR